MATNIQKRGNVYYFRRKIPLDLIERHGGKREIIRSLGTKNRAEAERLARRVSVDLDDEWQAMRATEPRTIPADHRVAEIDGRLVVTPPPPGGWPEASPSKRYHVGEIEFAEHDAAERTEQDDRDEEAAEAEAERLLRVLNIVERRRADAGLGPIPPAIKASMAPQRADIGQMPKPAPAASGQTLESLIPIWQRERKPAVKSVQNAMRAVADFGNPDLAAITRKSIIAHRDTLLGAGKAVNTINTRLMFIRTLLGIAKDRGLAEINHASDTALQDDKRAVDRRKPYSVEQVQAVMAATEGMKETHPSMYWLPRLARWTGARLNELHQLRKEDIEKREGVPGLMITDEGEHAPGVALRLKNADSRRWVPLAEPVRDFAEWASTCPDGALFPAKPNKSGHVSEGFSGRYGRFLRGTLKITDKRITFHSWRHGFADMCRAAGVAPDVRMALMGHAESGVSGTYGAGDGMPPKRLIEAMTRLVTGVYG